MTPALVVLLLQVEVSHGLPPGLLAAVVLHESSGRPRLVTRERGGCSVGLGQVYVPGCTARRTRRLQEPRYNLEQAAGVLVRSRRLCGAARGLPCASPWVHYNWHSRTWWPSVRRIWRRLVWRPGGEA